MHARLEPRKIGLPQHSVSAMHINCLRHHDKRRKRLKILKEIKVRSLPSVGPRGELRWSRRIACDVCNAPTEKPRHHLRTHSINANPTVSAKQKSSVVIMHSKRKILLMENTPCEMPLGCVGFNPPYIPQHSDNKLL